MTRPHSDTNAGKQDMLADGSVVVPTADLTGPIAAIVRSGWDVWFEGHYTHFWDDNFDADRSGNLGVAYLGADYLIQPGVLLGVLFQYDTMRDTSDTYGSKVSGHGWMVGPYTSIQLTDNLLFDARAAWGESYNDINPLGFYTDTFDTERWLIRGNLTGNSDMSQAVAPVACNLDIDNRIAVEPFDALCGKAQVAKNLCNLIGVDIDINVLP